MPLSSNLPCRRLLRFLCCAALLWTEPAHSAAPWEPWTLRNPNATAHHLSDVTYADGCWVSVGEGGTLLFSRDGLEWSNLLRHDAAFATVNLRSVAYAGGLWAAVGTERRPEGGNRGVLITSPDGQTWTRNQTVSEQLQNGNSYFSGIAFGGDRWIAVTWDGIYFTSNDGLDWTARISGLSDTSGIAYGGGQWVMWSDWGNYRTSSNGLSWDSGSGSFGDNIRNIRYLNGRWIAAMGERLLTSPDFQTWNEWRGGFADVAFGNNEWLAIGGKMGSEVRQLVIATSTDAINWTYDEPGMHNLQLNAVAFGDSRWVGVGSYGRMATSENGRDWQLLAPNGRELEALAYADDLWVAVGSQPAFPSAMPGLILTSPNGWDWEEPQVELEHPTVLYDVARGGGVWLAVGQEFVRTGQFYDERAVMFQSVDGQVWNRLTFSNARILHKVIHADGTWVAFGVRPRPEDDPWRPQPPVLLTSTDGSNWLEQSLPADQEIDQFHVTDVAYGNQRWIAVGYKENAATGARQTAHLSSTNTTEWTLREIGPSGGYAWHVLFAGDVWLITGYGPTNGWFMTSSDGEDWSEQRSTGHHRKHHRLR
jgi:hypothetical protein